MMMKRRRKKRLNNRRFDNVPLIQSNLNLGHVSIRDLKASIFYFSFPYFPMSISRVRDGKGNSFLNGNGMGWESRSHLT